MDIAYTDSDTGSAPWNKGRLLGQKKPLKLKEIWGIRVRLQISNKIRDLALLNLAIDSKLRGCDLVGLKVRDISHGSSVLSRSMILQKKTSQPVKLESLNRHENHLKLDRTCWSST